MLIFSQINLSIYLSIYLYKYPYKTTTNYNDGDGCLSNIGLICQFNEKSHHFITHCATLEPQYYKY